MFSDETLVRIGRAEYRLFLRALIAYAGLEKRTTRVGAVAMPALVRGRGTPLVLVHGFGADKESWLGLIARIDRSRAVAAFDLPGFGEASAIHPREASAKRQAKALLDAMSQLGIDRAHLVGSSMGGGICQRLARDYPSRVLSMTLLGSAAGVSVEKSELSLALERGENPLLTTSPEDFERLVGWMMSKKPTIPRPIALYQGTERMARAQKHAALFAGFVGAPKEERMPIDLEAIQAPALVIQGDEDKVIHPSTARALGSRLPDARLVMLPGVGHIPQLEAAGQVASSIDAFARAHDPR
jgi:abhydrolase domain-containing protein 6